MSKLPLDKLSQQVRLCTALFLMLLMLGACASQPSPPNNALLSARDAIATAESSGARQYAGSELDEARQQLVKAEQAVSDGDMVKAERHAYQARVSAELAAANTESSKALAINGEMKRSGEAVTEERGRKGEQQ